MVSAPFCLGALPSPSASSSSSSSPPRRKRVGRGRKKKELRPLIRGPASDAYFDWEDPEEETARLGGSKTRPPVEKTAQAPRKAPEAATPNPRSRQASAQATQERRRPAQSTNDSAGKQNRNAKSILSSHSMRRSRSDTSKASGGGARPEQRRPSRGKEERNRKVVSVPPMRRFPKIPSFRLRSAGDDSSSETTEPPSPVSSEQEGIGLSPPSLPADDAGLRYSLRSAICDGGTREPGSPTTMERRVLRPNGCHVNSSYWTDMGMRPYMEDRCAIEEMGSVTIETPRIFGHNSGSNVRSAQHVLGCPPGETMMLSSHPHRGGSPSVVPITWFGVFDGHGGERASQYCSDWLAAYVRNQCTFPADLVSALKAAFSSIDEDFIGTGYPDGSTACTCMVVGGQRIVCANVGDSRAIVVRRDGSVLQLSRDHKPGLPEETKRITDLGGKVVYFGRWRVQGLLAVSRSVGDAGLKPFVSADPEIVEYEIGKDDLFLVMASDGIWDVLENREVSHMVISHSCVALDGKLVTNPEQLRWTARRLCEQAKRRGSTDNFCALVVDLQSCNAPLSKPV